TDRLGDIDEKLDLIISNPPYFKKEEDDSRIHHQVKKFEPENAVFLPDHEYLSWYEKFFSQAYKLLTDNGCFLMEGDDKYLMILKDLAVKTGFMDIQMHRDYNNKYRFLIAHKKNKVESYG
ncbi:MAG: DNA methyltransferase, partial [Halobacteriovoraceae bacterium]|nr:DNA methyltransferase [Halobacteriovoraceae bacterium]